MKKSYILIVFTLLLALILTSCGSDTKVKVGTYSLGGDSTKQGVVIEKENTLKFVNFDENFFINMFKVPAPGEEDYDEEDYEGVLNVGRGASISYNVEKIEGKVYIKTKIGDFVEIKLPYDKNSKTIEFRTEKYTLV